MSDIRMYVTLGCPHCDIAKKFFDEKGITVEAIVVGFDPVIQAGVRVITNGAQMLLPLMICWANQEVRAGADAATLESMANAILSSRAGAPNPTPN